MNALVVGADRLGNIPAALAQFGIRIAQHVSGRNASEQRQGADLPRNTDLLILFTDFLGHNVMRRFRSLAQDQGIPVVACRRSVACLTLSLRNCRAVQQQSCASCSFAKPPPR